MDWFFTRPEHNVQIIVGIIVIIGKIRHYFVSLNR